MNVRSRPWAAIAGLSIALAAGLTACGGDDDDSAADITAACAAQADAIAGFNTMFSNLPEPPADGPPPPEFEAAIRSAFDADVAGPLRALETSAPDEIKDEVEEIALKSRQMRDQADPSVIDDEGFVTLTDTVDAYMQENCTGAKVSTQAVNYSYKDLPATLAVGTVRIEMENTADEAHEMVVLTRQPGVTESFDQLLALPEDQFEAKFAFIGAASADPGKTAYLVQKFGPGDYIFICSFGKGTTDDDDPKREEPHFNLGMKQEVKVA